MPKAMLINFLRPWRFKEIVVAEHYNQVIEVLSAGMIDLIITSYQIGQETNGIDLIKEIRKNKQNENVKIIIVFLKSDENSKAVSVAKEAGVADKVLFEIFQIDELKEVIKRLLGKRSARITFTDHRLS
ncbi:MAG: response regulator [Patescibacteria group bacterium]